MHNIFTEKSLHIYKFLMARRAMQFKFLLFGKLKKKTYKEAMLWSKTEWEYEFNCMYTLSLS